MGKHNVAETEKSAIEILVAHPPSTDRLDAVRAVEKKMQWDSATAEGFIADLEKRGFVVLKIDPKNGQERWVRGTGM